MSHVERRVQHLCSTQRSETHGNCTHQVDVVHGCVGGLWPGKFHVGLHAAHMVEMWGAEVAGLVTRGNQIQCSRCTRCHDCSLDPQVLLQLPWATIAFCDHTWMSEMSSLGFEVSMISFTKPQQVCMCAPPPPQHTPKHLYSVLPHTAFQNSRAGNLNHLQEKTWRSGGRVLTAVLKLVPFH